MSERTIEKSALAETAYTHVRQLLSSGSLRPGQKLSETRIARELGMSRTPVREAIKRLISDNLLEQTHGRGTYLREPTPDEMRHIFVVREALEATAAGLAAEHATDEQLAQMKQCIRVMYQSIRTARREGVALPDHMANDDWNASDRRLHTLILEAGANPWLTRIAQDSQIIFRAFFDLSPDAFDMNNTYSGVYIEHRRIYSAIAKRDPAAARDAMLQHIRLGLERYTKQHPAASEEA